MRTKFGTLIDRGRGRRGSVRVGETDGYVIVQRRTDRVADSETRGYVLVQSPTGRVAASETRVYVIVEP